MTNEKAKIIEVIGWTTIIGGIIGSLVMGNKYPSVTFIGSYTDETYNWTVAIVGIISSIISGVIFLGFAEIIKLLQEKVNYSNKLEVILNTIARNQNTNKVENKVNEELPRL